MSQEDLEKAYTEAVDQLARAVEANRLLTQRLEKQDVELGELRGTLKDIHTAWKDGEDIDDAYVEVGRLLGYYE